MIKPLFDWPRTPEETTRFRADVERAIREDDQRFFAWLIVVLMALACIVMVAFAAHAQESADVHASAGGTASPDVVPANGPAAEDSGSAAGRIANAEETALVLAIAMVAEAGWDAPIDHAAIAHTLQRKADRHGLTLEDVLVRYVAIYRIRSPRAQWVRDLRLDATKPDGWPSHLSWSAHVDRWLVVVERARAFLRGELPDPCHAEHWGMRTGVDAQRAQRAGWILARCVGGQTKNAFWSP